MSDPINPFANEGTSRHSVNRRNDPNQTSTPKPVNPFEGDSALTAKESREKRKATIAQNKPKIEVQKPPSRWSRFTAWVKSFFR